MLAPIDSPTGGLKSAIGDSRDKFYLQYVCDWLLQLQRPAGTRASYMHTNRRGWRRTAIKLGKYLLSQSLLEQRSM